MRPYFDYRVSKTIDPLIRVTYEDGTASWPQSQVKLDDGTTNL